MLRKLNIDPVKIKNNMELVVRPGKEEFRGGMRLTPRSKKIIEVAVDEFRDREEKKSLQLTRS